MKRVLSLILAALLATSALVACETTPAETNAPATDPVVTEATETDPAETDAPVTTASMITENGEAKAEIVVAEGADQLLILAAEELAYHVQKVSGAALATVNTASDAALAIVIGTPESNPELNELFADDIAWLTTLEEDGKQYGSDGFAIRQAEGKLYIFGATPRGALNGVYDFIEDNMGVLWIRSDESYGLIYDEMPTIAITKADYREKSPFEVRGWHLCGIGFHDDVVVAHSDKATEIMISRNKLNTKFSELDNQQVWSTYESLGLTPLFLGHYMKYWVLNSPTYDPNITEYWNTDANGVPMTAETSTQINYWSDLTADTVAAAVLDFLSENDVDYIGIGVEDNDTCYYLPLSDQPYEYEPGKFVDPGDTAYMSTVYFSFMNKIARQVKEAYPDVMINTYAYWLVEKIPLCELEDNINVVIAPILEDMASLITDTENGENANILANMEQWKDRSNDLFLYTYYGSSLAIDSYERPIWDKMQSDLRYYASIGIEGLIPEGMVDCQTEAGKGFGNSDTWSMNALTFWLFSKLSWNPDEDVDALIAYFCDKMYGEASEEMQEYYRLIEYGWQEGDSSIYLWNFKLDEAYYFDTFVYQMDVEVDIVDTLNAAYEAAENDVIKARILPIKESYEAAFPEE